MLIDLTFFLLAPALLMGSQAPGPQAEDPQGPGLQGPGAQVQGAQVQGAAGSRAQSPPPVVRPGKWAGSPGTQGDGVSGVHRPHTGTQAQPQATRTRALGRPGSAGGPGQGANQVRQGGPRPERPNVRVFGPKGAPVPGLPGPGEPDPVDRSNRDATSITELDGVDGSDEIDLVPSFSKSASATRSISATAIRQPWGGQSLLFYELRMNPGTGFQEKFLLHVPTPRPVGPTPMLVVFHKFGSNHFDVFQNTTFLQEAAARGWFLVCPLGASKKSFSSVESQLNIEAVLDFTTALFTVDPDRIYGVGFSMGGGAVTNYAARHLDPARPMFAAIVNHSGGVDLYDSYRNEPGAQFIFDFWFGNGSAGSADPWRMARSSVIQRDPHSQQVLGGMDLARNLLPMSMRSVRASQDGVAYLMPQNDALDSHLKALGVQQGGRYGYYVLPYVGHSWDMLNEKATCDWLAARSRELPTEASLLADRNGVYYHFDVEQSVGGSFSPFHFRVDSTSNELTLDGTENIERIVVDTVGAGLDASQGMRVHVGTLDGQGDRLSLRSVPHWPSQVLRDGIVETSWSYEPTTELLTLIEFDGGAHTWEILP